METFANFASSTLNGSINASVTTLVVVSGSTFPAAGNFRIRIGTEILLVTAKSTNTFTVTRGAEGSTAASHTNGDAVTHILTAASLAQTITDNKPLTFARALCGADTNFTSIGWTDVTGCSLSLAAGTWLIMANIELRNSGGSNSTGGCKLYYGSTDLIAGEYSLGSTFNAVFTLFKIAVIPSTQTVKLAGRNQNTNVFKALQFGDVDIGGASIPGTILEATLIA